MGENFKRGKMKSPLQLQKTALLVSFKQPIFATHSLSRDICYASGNPVNQIPDK